MGLSHSPSIVTNGLVLCLDAGNVKSYDGSAIDEDLSVVSSGGFHATAIKTDGTLWSWGYGSSGQLGNFSATDRSTPVTTFAGGTNWKQVSGGYFHTSVIKTDGTLWLWGNSGPGALGNGITTGNISTPITTFAGGNDWKQVGSANQFTLAIKTDGTLWTWGGGGNGRLGNGLAAGLISTPVTTFAGGSNWKQVSGGSVHAAAVKTDGTLWTWGLGGSGQLGNATTANTISTPITTFAGGNNWKQVSCGSSYHTSAVKTDGTLWVWGNNFNGQLGNASTTNTSTPVTTFAGGTNWKQVSAGINHIGAVKTDGTLWTWGFGGFGQLGTNDAGARSTPVTTFAGGTDWKQVSAGESYISAIKTDGTLWSWGRGSYGRLGNGVTTGSISTPVTTFTGGTNWNIPSVSGTNWANLLGTGNNGTLTNGPAFVTGNGGSISFDGINDYSTSGALPGSFTSFTVIIWFYPTSITNYQNPIDCNYSYNGSTGNIGPRLEIYTTGQLMWVYSNDTAVNNNFYYHDVLSSGLAANTWHCATITYNGGTNTSTTYYNGNATGLSRTLVGSPTGFVGTMNNVNIGRGFHLGGAERIFTGRVSNASIYNRALTAAEVSQNFNALRGRFGI